MVKKTPGAVAKTWKQSLSRRPWSLQNVSLSKVTATAGVRADWPGKAHGVVGETTAQRLNSPSRSTQTWRKPASRKAFSRVAAV